jgi:hypothetical protein
MENNVLNWFRNSFHNDFDEDGAHKVMSNESCFVEELEQKLLDARKNDIINVLKILNDNYPISDGGSSWLETEEDFNRTADEIINFEKHYKENNVEENKDDNTPCECWNGPNHKGWACRIFCISSNECDGITCKKDCDWYNSKGYFKVPNSVKKTKK